MAEEVLWYWEGLRAGDELYVEIPGVEDSPKERRFWCRVVRAPRDDDRKFALVRTTLGVFDCVFWWQVVFCRPELNEPLRKAWAESLSEEYGRFGRRKKRKK